MLGATTFQIRRSKNAHCLTLRTQRGSRNGTLPYRLEPLGAPKVIETIGTFTAMQISNSVYATVAALATVETRLKWR